MKRLVLAFVASSALLSVSAPASAQVWLKDRQATQGAGIRSGDFELHPGIAAELGYDSNYFNRAANKPYPVVDTVRLRITPQFHVSTLGQQRRADGSVSAPPKVSFSAGAAFIYSHFLMNAGKGTGADQYRRLGRDFEWGMLGDLALGIAPGRPWGLNIFDQFQRTAQPSLDPLVESGLNRIENRVAGELVHTRPGGLLDWRLGYAFGVTYFENGPNPAVTGTTISPQDFNNYRHELYTTGRWRFLPRTALVYNGSFWWQNYANDRPGLANSRPVRTRIGLSGLVTDRFSVLALVGWGAGFYSNAGVGDRDFDSVIGQVELRYFLTGAAPEAGQPAPATSSSIGAGFTRDFYNSYIGNYYERNRGYVTMSAVFAHQFLVTLDAGVAGIHYGTPLDRESGRPLRSTGFTNIRIDASLFAEYRAKDWLGFNATYQYLQEVSNVTLPSNLAANSPRYGLGFNRHQVFAGVRVFF